MSQPFGQTPATSGRAPVVALLGANAISGIGNVMTGLAVPWFVLETTGSAAKTGLVAFFTVVPNILASFFGGALVDRTSNRQLSIASDLMSGCTIAMVPLLYHTVGLEFWHLLVLMFLGALLDAPGITARTAVLPTLVERAGIRLERANGASQSIFSLSWLVGPPLAGVLIAWLGTSNVLWIDAATFAVSAVLVALLVPADDSKPESEGNYWQNVRSGLAFLRADRFLSTILVVACVANFVGAPLFAVVMPVFAKEAYGSARDLGLMMGGLGAGAIASAFLFGVIGHRAPRAMTMIGGFAFSTPPILALALLPPLAVTIACLFVVGLASGMVNPLLMTVIQERTPAELRGRIFGAVFAFAMLAAPAGMLLAGWSLEAFGLQSVLILIGGVFVATTIGLARQRVVREMGGPPDESSPPDPAVADARPTADVA
ncbi:MAG: MFS transporter [Thermomicrobiales bacterium]